MPELTHPGFWVPINDVFDVGGWAGNREAGPVLSGVAGAGISGLGLLAAAVLLDSASTLAGETAGETLPSM